MRSNTRSYIQIWGGKKPLLSTVRRMFALIWITLAVSVLPLANTYTLAKTTIQQSSAFDANDSLYEKKLRIAYTIQKGDTLWALAQKHDITVADLQIENRLKGDLIVTGKTLYIPQTVIVAYEDRRIVATNTVTALVKPEKPIVVAKEASKAHTPTSDTDSDRYWLAKIIEAEAEGEPIEGKIAVGAVVLNRVQADWFPDSIRDVIFQKYNGTYQFTPAGNGRLKRIEPSEAAYEAADRALAGEDPTEGALYFYNPKLSKSTFFKKKELLASIGNHQFFQ